MSKVALFVELKAKPGKEEDLAAWLIEVRPLAVDEDRTLTWLAIRLDAETFGIFDTFDEDDSRQAHLKGPIAASLMTRADELLAGPPNIRTADVLADKLSAYSYVTS